MRGGEIFFIEDAKLQREHRGRKYSSTERSKLQRVVPAQTTFTHFYRLNKIKQTPINYK
jgi:hypothetical protein